MYRIVYHHLTRTSHMKKLSLLLLSLISFNVLAIEVLRISTTTSTENSGLLNVLHPVFEEDYNLRLQVIAVGTGKALKLAENGDVDLVLVHAPTAEMAFVNQGYGVGRQAVMHNDFVLIGPTANQAGISVADSTAIALKKIAANQSKFVSRGDDSGTHKKELSLWKASGVMPQGDWYLSVGQGMGAALKIADEKQAYTLTDRGTYIAFKAKINLVIVHEGDALLHNPYHVIAVNPQKHPHTRFTLAKKYIAYITGSKAQALISEYRIQGEQLFYPDVNKH